MSNEQVAMSNEFLEMRIIKAVRDVLSERVNELLCDMQYPVPPVEWGEYRREAASPVETAVVPLITLSACERTEKERIVSVEAYSMTVTFTLPESPESELHCYAYSGAISRALQDNPTLGGFVDRAVITAKKYVSPKKANCGQGWELVITLRLTVEEMN
jgi:hypothetical protein